MNKEELKKALGPVKGYELARCLNRLRVGCNYSGSLKSDLLDDIAKSQVIGGALHAAIVSDHGSLQKWVAHVLERVKEDRERQAKQKSAAQALKSRRKSDRERMMRLLEKIREGVPVGSEDRDFFFEKARTCIHYYYITT